MRNRSKSQFLLIFTLLVIPIVVMANITTTHAYTSCDGIEEGDVVLVDYTGRTQSDGEEFDSGDDVEFTISPDRLIEGFYRGMLGLKIGERDTITVPPSQGYSSGELAGETLIFDVFVEAVIRGERPCDDGAGSGSSFGNSLASFLGWTVGIAAAGFLGIYGYYSLQKTTTPKCEHCASQGRTERFSEGKCQKCGNYYCRQSFSRGCPNCGSNKFDGSLLNLGINDENVAEMRRQFWQEFIWKTEDMPQLLAIVYPDTSAFGSLSKSQIVESLSLIRLTDRPFELFENTKGVEKEILEWISSLASVVHRIEKEAEEEEVQLEEKG